MTVLATTREKPPGFDSCVVCMRERATSGTYIVGSCSTKERAHAYCVECLQSWTESQVQNLSPAATPVSCLLCGEVFQNLGEMQAREIPWQEMIESTFNSEFDHPDHDFLKRKINGRVDLEKFFYDSSAFGKGIIASCLAFSPYRVCRTLFGSFENHFEDAAYIQRAEEWIDEPLEALPILV